MLREGMGCLGTATHISGLYQVEAGQDVPRSVGQYAGADIAAPVRQHAEGEPVHDDAQHRPQTLITVPMPNTAACPRIARLVLPLSAYSCRCR